MALTWTVDEALASIKSRADLLDTDQRFSDDVLLMLLNEELGSWLVPIIAEQRAEFFVVTQDTLLDGESTRHINIPGDAVGGRVRLVQYLSTNKRPIFSLVQI